MPPPRSRNRNKPHSRLKLLELERRDNPAIPVGLTDISSLLGSLALPSGHAETHAIIRNEATTLTVDQAGTGSAGTFTVTVDAGSFSSDTAFGGAAGIPSVTTTGSGTGQTTAHFVMSGTYANGAFTVTGKTYSETGSYTVIQSTVTTYPKDGDSQITRVDTTRSGNHTLGWSAAVGTDGQLAYTSYDFVSTEAAHTYTKQDYSGGGFHEMTTDAAFTVHTVGSGPLATYTGTDWSTTTSRTRYPNPGGSPFESTSTWGWNNPVGGSVQLSGLYESTADWTWNAGTANATNYTFHGVAVRNDALAETATLRAEGFGGSALDVNSFSSTSHTSDTGHVIDEEPGTPTSGTELYHRDELGTSVADMTGSGSYISGYANADFHAAVTSSYAVANRFDVRDRQSTGLDDDGQAYTQIDNYSSTTNGSGTATNTHDYHDSGTGLILTGETIGFVGGSTVGTRAWGTRNGQAFDTPSVNVESVNRSLTIPGSAGVVAKADGLENAFPYRGMILPKDWMFCQVGGIPGAILGRGPQAWFNAREKGLEGQAKRKVVVQYTMKVELFVAFGMTPNGEKTPAMGSFTILSGDTFAIGMLEDGKFDKEAAKYVKQSGKAGVVDGLTASKPRAEITYAFDGADKAVRSGNVAVQYRIVQDYTGTINKGINRGKAFFAPITLVTGDIIVRDGKWEKLPLKQ